MNRQQLIEDNIKLVYALVSKEYPTYIHDEDIIQSGMVGLCNAAKYWDENKSAFSTYAWKCIRNEINKEFINRKPHYNQVSLETPIGEEGTLADVLIGDEGVNYIGDDEFYDTLSPIEQEVFLLYNRGYNLSEIAQNYDWSVQKTQKTVRIIKRKWRKFNAD